MKRYGFIGAGSMGTMLIRQLTKTKTISPQNIIVSTRTKQKLIPLAKQIHFKIASTNEEVAKKSDIIFLCVKPLEVENVLRELHHILTPKKLLISIAAGVTLKNLHSWTKARTLKIIPSITSEKLKGISLISFGKKATSSDKKLIFKLFRPISRPIEIKEKNFELFADLTSCAPAFIAAIMQEFAFAALRKEKFPKELAEILVRETLQGTAELLSQMKFEELITRVATKGGITEEGVKIIRCQSPRLFDELLRVTLAKHDRLKKLLLNS